MNKHILLKYEINQNWSPDFIAIIHGKWRRLTSSLCVIPLQVNNSPISEIKGAQFGIHVF